MGIDLHLSTCVDTQSPKYLEMAQGHISLSLREALQVGDEGLGFDEGLGVLHALHVAFERVFVCGATVMTPLGPSILSLR
jgi:hypothetical protein